MINWFTNYAPNIKQAVILPETEELKFRIASRKGRFTTPPFIIIKNIPPNAPKLPIPIIGTIIIYTKIETALGYNTPSLQHPTCPVGFPPNTKLLQAANYPQVDVSQFTLPTP